MLCCHIGLLFRKRLDTIFLRHWILKYPDSPIHMFFRFIVDYFFQSGEQIYKHTLNLPDTCGWKLYPERKSCRFKNIRIRVDGAYINCANKCQ